jgi:hypothetical protein
MSGWVRIWARFEGIVLHGFMETKLSQLMAIFA